MTITRRTAILATALALIAGQTAAAQRSRSSSMSSSDNSYEFGMDAALSFVDGNALFQLPAQAVRFGFPITPTVNLEPALGLITGSGTTILNFDVGVPFNVDQTSGGSDIFLRPVFGIQHFSAGAGNSTTQSSLGVGAGIRIPVVQHLDARFEARYRRWFGNNGFNQVDILGGVSILMP